MKINSLTITISYPFIQKHEFAIKLLLLNDTKHKQCVKHNILKLATQSYYNTITIYLTQNLQLQFPSSDAIRGLVTEKVVLVKIMNFVDKGNILV